MGREVLLGLGGVGGSEGRKKEGTLAMVEMMPT